MAGLRGDSRGQSPAHVGTLRARCPAGNVFPAACTSHRPVSRNWKEGAEATGQEVTTAKVTLELT